MKERGRQKAADKIDRIVKGKPWRMEVQCDNCPFAKDDKGAFLRKTLQGARWREITQSLLRGEVFWCHKTTEWGDDEDDYAAKGKELVCAGSIEWQAQHKVIWRSMSRKGAIQLREGQKGLIPGSMGTRSYIVSGKANPVSFNSAPHGAGRNFSRGEARRRFTMDDLEKSMLGISVDEYKDAYKDIDMVMERSKELVTIDHVLRQIVSIKGD